VTEVTSSPPSRLGPAPNAPLEKIEWRADGPPSTNRDPPTARFVPYVGAATVAALLDLWVGPDGWADVYEAAKVDGKEAMWCRLSLRGADGSWVTKTDIGVPSNVEAQKGAVSDAFKRAACLKWGVARNVYDLPTLWAPCRVFQKAGKPQAAPTDRTLPHLLGELKRLGFGDVGVTRLEAHDDAADGDEARPPPAEPSRVVDPATGEVTGGLAGAVLAAVEGLSPEDMMAAVEALETKERNAFRKWAREVHNVLRLEDAPAEVIPALCAHLAAAG